MLVPHRTFSSPEYRYGFQGQEMDDEIKGNGNSLNYKYRMHDPRVGRFFAVDPLFREYPHNSTYAFSENSTIAFVEIEGLEKEFYYNAVEKAKENAKTKTFGTETDITGLYGASIDVLPIVGDIKGLAEVFTGKDLVTGEKLGWWRLSGLMFLSELRVAKNTTELFTAAKVVDKVIDKIQTINPSKIRFSQSSVNGAEEIIKSMKKKGWKGDPVDVVTMNDGLLTSIDNTRILAASEAGIDVQAKVHKYDDALPKDLVERFTTKKGTPKTWGEAVEFRIQKQKATYRKNNPNGSMQIEGKLKE